jgi:hypothetical protein
MDRIDRMLTKFNEIRTRKLDLEAEEENIKNDIQRAMDAMQTDVIETNNYRCKRSYRFRETISKKDVPEDLWDTYCKVSEYSVLTLKCTYPV